MSVFVDVCSQIICVYVIESLKNELELRFAEEQEQTTFTHAQQLQAAKMELDRAMDLIRQKVPHQCLCSVLY